LFFATAVAMRATAAANMPNCKRRYYKWLSGEPPA
jgi:hypothetical protein